MSSARCARRGRRSLRVATFIATDSCCDPPHAGSAADRQAALWLAQHYAIDYDRLDDDRRIYSGEKEDLESYTIYGQEALAVADGTVVKVVDGLAEQVPGEFPRASAPRRLTATR